MEEQIATSWQTWAVYGIVALTVGVFAWRIFRRKGGAAHCGDSCGCPRAEVRRNEVIEKVVQRQMKR